MENNNQPTNEGYGTTPQGNVPNGPTQAYGPQQPYYPPPQPMPAQGQPYYPHPPVQKPPKKPMDPKQKKLIITLCAAFGGLLVLGIAAAIVLPIVLKVDYKATHEVADRANDLRRDIEKSDSCGGVISYVDSIYQSKSDYEKYVLNCRESLVAFKSSIEELAETSGVKRDAEIKAEWDKFKSSYDVAIAPYEELIGIYSDWHAHIANWIDATKASDWWRTMNEDRVKSLISPLTNSTQSKIKAYGDGYVTIRWKQIQSYQAYQAAADAYSASLIMAANRSELRDDRDGKREVYNGLNADFTEYERDKPSMSDIEGLVGIDLDKSDNKFLTKFNAVYSQIYDKYVEQELTEFFGF